MKNLAGHLHFLNPVMCVFFWFLIVNGRGEFLFVYRFSGSRVMSLKAHCVVSFSLRSSFLGSAYLFLSGVEVLC